MLLLLGFVVLAVIALALGWVMGRRGFDAWAWTLIGFILGPIAIVIAVYMNVSPPDRTPRLLRRGESRPGTIDVLVGADGSPEARAVVAVVERLLDGRIGRLTLARVTAVDIAPDDEWLAEIQLEKDRRVAPGASTVLLRGQPTAALQEYARAAKYQLLAVGTRGEGRSHAVLGSVASSLARGTDIPVLLADGSKNATLASAVTQSNAAS